MSFDDDLETAADLLLESFPSTIAYTPYLGVATTYDAIVDGERVENVEENGRNIKRRIRDVVLSKADLSTPALKAIVSISGTIYAVRDYFDLPGNQLQLVLTRLEPMDKARQDRSRG